MSEPATGAGEALGGQSALERALAPLDVARKRLLQAAPIVRPLLADRHLRVAVAATAAMFVALTAALLAPGLFLSVSPLVLGVPHLVGDVRYLWLRTGHWRRIELWLAIGGPIALSAWTGTFAAGFLGAAGAILVARAPVWRKLVGVAVVGGALAWTWHAGPLADLIYAHAHNVVAVVLWWIWVPRSRRVHFVPLALFAVASVSILFGALEPPRFVLESDEVWLHAWQLGYPWSAEIGLRLAVLFCFAQSVHYMVWIRLIPEDTRPQPTPRPFVASLRALRQDVPWPLLAIAAATFVVFGAWAFVDLQEARISYLRFAIFHGQLELAILGLLWAEGRPAAR